MKGIRYIGKTLKQDETVQTPWSVLVTTKGETKCNNETDTCTFLSQEFFLKRNVTMKQICTFLSQDFL